MKIYRKPSSAQVLYVVETMLCEHGCDDHLLDGDATRAAWAFIHIGIGDCPNRHHPWRKTFWKKYKSLKEEEIK